MRRIGFKNERFFDFIFPYIFILQNIFSDRYQLEFEVLYQYEP